MLKKCFDCQIHHQTVHTYQYTPTYTHIYNIHLIYTAMAPKNRHFQKICTHTEIFPIWPVTWPVFNSPLVMGRLFGPCLCHQYMQRDDCHPLAEFHTTGLYVKEKDEKGGHQPKERDSCRSLVCCCQGIGELWASLSTTALTTMTSGVFKCQEKEYAGVCKRKDKINLTDFLCGEKTEKLRNLQAVRQANLRVPRLSPPAPPDPQLKGHLDHAKSINKHYKGLMYTSGKQTGTAGRED